MAQPLKRSPNQNAYAWGVVVKALQAAAAERGQVLSKEQAKRLACIAVGHRELKDTFGVLTVEAKPTKSLSVPEFEELMERIRAWAAEQNIIIPLPGEGIRYPTWP